MFARKGKKSLAVILAIVMILSLLPISTLADSLPVLTGAPVYTVTNGTATGTDITIDKSAERVYVDGDDSVYYDVTLNVHDTYKDDSVFVEGKYQLRIGKGNKDFVLPYETAEACEDAYSGTDIAKINVIFSDGSTLLFQDDFYVSKAQLNKGVYFMGYYIEATDTWTSLSQDKVSFDPEKLDADGYYVTSYYVDVQQGGYWQELYEGVQALNVTDSVPADYTFVRIQSANAGTYTPVDPADYSGTITWDLSGATKSDDVPYYTLVYRVQITATTAGNYLMGSATLTYHDYPSGSNGTLLSPNPYVTISYPVYYYAIEFYKKSKTTGDYVLQTGDTLTGEVRGTGVTVSAPDGYANKYQSDYYAFNHGATSMAITANNQVMQLYYDPISAKVISYHYLITKTISDAHPDGEYSAPQLIGTVDSQIDEGKTLYKGDSYTADLLSYDPYTGNDYVSDSATISSLAAGTNTLTFYYLNTTGSRTEVSYAAHYFYRTDTYQLNSSGKYELTPGDYLEDTTAAVTGSGWHGDGYTAPDKPNGYSPDHVDSSSGARAITLDKNGNNVINVYYKKTVDNRVPATLTITHNYYVQTISGTDLDDSYNELENQMVYVDETYGATVNTGYDGYTWTCTSTVTSIKIGQGANTLTVNYYRDARVETTVTVNHYFFAYTWGVDGNGDAVPVEPASYTSMETEQLAGTYYVGGSATASAWPLTGAYSGYSARTSNIYELNGLSASGNVINLFYDYIPPNDLGEADVTVKHVYNTYTTYIAADGSTVFNERTTNSTSEAKVSGYAGEWFMASPDYTDANGDDGYTLVSPDLNGATSIKVTLSATGGEFIFTYARYFDERVETTYSIQPVYVDLTTQVNASGEIETVISNVDTSAPTTPSGTFYVGQKISVNPDNYSKTGYILVAAAGDIHDILSDAHYNNSTYTNVVLGSNPIVITLYYVKVTSALVPATVTIRNHYTFVTYTSPGGVYTVTTDPDNETVSDAPITGYYAGQYFTTTDKGTGRKDYSLAAPEPDATIRLGEGTNYVDFYYYGTSDETVAATVQVIHDYTITDWDGTTNHYTVNGADTTTPNIFSGSYAGGSFTATPNYQAGAFSWDNITDVDGATVTPPAEGSDEGEIVCSPLSEGLNVITIYYNKTIDTRETTKVTVKHVYTTHDIYAGTDSVVGYEDTFNTIAEGVWVGNSFKATPVTFYDSKTFSVQSADPADYTISELAAVTEETPDPNVITINYYREIDSRDDSDYDFTVRYVNGYTGEAIGTPVTAKAKYNTTLDESMVGDILEDDGWINARRPSGYQSGEVGGYITITADAENNVIIVTYNYSGGGDDNPTYYTVNYVFNGSHPDATLPASATYARNALVQIADGYDDVTTADGVWHFEGWSRTEDFNITGNTTITGTWTYTPNEVVIVDEETPQAPAPEEPIEEPEVPLGNLPQTGSTAEPVNPMWTLGMLALSFSMAAAGLTITFSRRKDEEQK